MRDFWKELKEHDRTDILREKAKEFSVLAEMTQEILDGKKEADLYKKYDINKAAYRKLLMQRVKGYERTKLSLNPDSRSIMTWQERMFSYACPWVEYKDYPDDINETVDFILTNSLYFTKEEREVADLYFRCGVTMDYVAKLKGLSVGQTQLILDGFAQKLKSGKRALILEYGLENAETILKLRKMLSEEKRKDAIGRLRKSLSEARSSNDVERLEQECMAAAIMVEKYKQEKKAINAGYVKSAEESIDHIEMPNRLRNLLHRKDIHTMDDLIAKKFFIIDNMQNINGFGTEAICSIIDLCNRYDIPVEAHSTAAKKLYNSYIAKTGQRFTGAVSNA